MIKIYHSPNSRSLRVIWLLEEMHVEYQLVWLDSANMDELREKLAKPDFRRLSPLGLLPVIEDDDGGEARAVFESAAIMDYLFEVYGNRGIRPEKGTAAWFAFNQWFNAAETLIAPFEQVSLHTSDLPEAVRHRDVADYFKARCLGYYDVLERLVQHQDYVAGDLFTAADIMIGYLVLMVNHSGVIDPGAYPAIAEYEKRLMARPALRQALAVQSPGS